MGDKPSRKEPIRMSQEEIKDEFDNKFKKNIMNALDGQDAADISIDIDQIDITNEEDREELFAENEA